jgi:hypothetical protein
VERIVGEDAHRTPLHPDQSGNHSRRETRAKLEDRPGVGQYLEHAAHVIGAPPIFGDTVTEQRLVSTCPIRHRALKVGEVALCRYDGAGFVVREEVDHSVGNLDAQRADLVGSVNPQTPAFDHGRTAHSDVGIRGGDDDIATAEKGGIACEAPSRNDPYQGHQTAQVPKEGEGLGVESGDDCHVGIAGAPATPLSKKNDRESQPFNQREEPILLPMVHLTLGAGQDRVVVGEDGGACVLVIEEMAVYTPDARDQPVRRSSVDQIVEVAPRPLGRDDQRSVLLETARIAEIGDVLAGRPPSRSVSPFRRIRPSRIEGVRHTFSKLGQFRPNGDRGDCGGGRRGGCVNDSLFQQDQETVCLHGVTRSDDDLPNRSRPHRNHLMLHLHRFENEQRLAVVDTIAEGYGHCDDSAGEWREHG